MPPRIRSFLRRPPYAREAKSPARPSRAKTRVNALTAPSVFRDFVETLQRLDPPATSKRAAEGSGAAMSKRAAPVSPGYGRRSRKQSGNGHARPRGRRH